MKNKVKELLVINNMFFDNEGNNKIVIKHNELIEARYNLSLNEQRVFIYLLSTIDFSQHDFSKMEISASKIADMFGIKKSGSIFIYIEEACKKLFDRSINISKDPKRKRWIHLFNTLDYKIGSGIVTAEFHPELKPYVLALQSHFTQYQLAAVIKFRSQYSIRIYELLKMHQYQVTNGIFYKKLTLEELKQILDIKEGEYKLYGDFERRVTKVAQEEINTLSDLFILDIERIKSGRKITALKFICQIKDNNLNQNQNILPNEIKLKDNEELITIVEKDLKDIGIPKKTIDQWIIDYDVAIIQRNLAYSLEEYKKGKVKSLPAYLSKALQHDYANISYMTKYIEQQKLEQKALKVKEEEEKLKAQHEKERQLAKQQEQEILNMFNSFSKEKQKEIAHEILADFPGIQQQYKKHGLESNMAKCIIISHFKNNSI